MMKIMKIKRGQTLKTKISAGLFLISLLSALLMMSGCSWYPGYGKLRIVQGTKEGVSIGELMENWQEYTIFYAGLSVQNPSAVMFDPKNDDKTLVTEKWVEVKDQETLLALIHWLDADVQFYPKLYRIIGPHNQLFGFLYTAWDHVHMKLVDEKTLWIDDLPLPPIDYGPTRADANRGQ